MVAGGRGFRKMRGIQEGELGMQGGGPRSGGSEAGEFRVLQKRKMVREALAE